MVRVLYSGSEFDPHIGHGSLLKLRQFHLPLICLSIGPFHGIGEVVSKNSMLESK